MNNWWQSIQARALQIKGSNLNWGRDAHIAALLVLVSFAGFGLGRLSSYEESRPAVHLLQATTYISNPLMIGGSVLASKNGTKYHFPWCGSAQRINEENRIWFKSIEAAKVAGYLPSGNCKGLE